MNATSLTVSIIDPNEAPRRSIAFLLKAAGYDPRAYASLSDFCACTAPDEPTLIVLDAPGLDHGSPFDDAALRDQMREHQTIVMSAAPDPDLVNTAFKCGAIDFVFKPFPKRRLIEAICSAEMAQSDPETQVAHAVANGDASRPMAAAFQALRDQSEITPV